MNKLQQSVDFFRAKFGESDEEKKQKNKTKTTKNKKFRKQKFENI